MDMQLRQVNFKITTFNDENRTFTAIASTGDIDRHGEKIDQASWNLDNFLQNPVIPWGHDYDSPPVARALEIGVVDDQLIFVCQFPMPGVYPFADTIWNLYRNGYLRAFSVGFIPMEYEPQTDTFSECELLEISAVTVPANASALALAYKSGVLSDEGRKMMIGNMKSMIQKLESDELNLALKGERKDTKHMSKLRQTVAALKDNPNLKAGATLSAATMETLQKALDGVAEIDEIVDDLQPMLADLMGVQNPDEDESGSNDDSDEKAIKSAKTKDNEDGDESGSGDDDADNDNPNDGKSGNQDDDSDGTNEDDLDPEDVEIPEDFELTEDEQKEIADHVAATIEAEKANLTGKVI